MLKVWTGKAESGFLDRHGERGSTFAYLAEAGNARAVSVTMPVRLLSWSVSFGLLPVFDMNLPEGFLRERLRLAFAKATGTFDDYDLLSVVGRSQVGHVRFTRAKEQLLDDVPFQSVDEILESRRAGDLFRYLIEKFAAHSGISGVQPKVFIRDEEAFSESGGTGKRLSQSCRGATHIVKLWDPNEFPQLAANEYFCLAAARKCGLQTPACRLAVDGTALVIDRFDLRVDGTYRGFEDFCVLNARRTDEKYRGSYESSILKRFAQYATPENVHADLEKLFTLIALNCGLRNGDAHLKNFGILYDEVEGEARLAPAYDLVTTSVYLANDSLALTLNGSTAWPEAKILRKLGEVRTGVTPGKVRAMLERVAEGIHATTKDIRSYMRRHAEFAEIGARMIAHWETGIRTSLRG